ncbi:hypothetical protein [Polaromonas sp.]|uniref:hypothetical protein n=1 Tax=Polaromonas sp. TaxID=1869339 RepID=UPI0024887897|nr:hypothetical protein [Polaromonas sp.]MDI1338466.1 hypothetical protein [Polaromonas sp.]
MLVQKTIVSALLASAFVVACPGLARGETPTAIEEAHRAYYRGQLQRALQIYEQLAATGNAEAAERAGFIWLRRFAAGAQGSQADIARATGLLEQAASGGRQGALFLLGMLDSAD